MDARWAIVFGAVFAPVAGIAAAYLLNEIAAIEQTRRVAAYAVGAVPLSALVGAVAGWAFARRRSLSSLHRVLGAGMALVAATITASLQSALRFHYLGAGGGYSFGSFLYTEEIAMLGGIVPGVLALGAAFARGRVVAVAAIAGVVSALLVGPILILSSTFGAAGLTPPILGVATVGAIAVGARLAVERR